MEEKVLKMNVTSWAWQEKTSSRTGAWSISESQGHESEWCVCKMVKWGVFWSTGNLRDLVMGQEVTEGSRARLGRAGVFQAGYRGMEGTVDELGCWSVGSGHC